MVIKASFVLYCFVLIFVPLAFGTIDPWAYLVAEASCWLALLMYLVAVVLQGHSFVRVPGFLPFALFLGWNLLQVLPLPTGLVHLLSPATLQAYQEGLGSVKYVPLSLAPLFTIKEFFRFAGYFAFYVLTIQLLLDPRRLRRTLNLVLVVGVVIALEGIIQKLMGQDLAWGIRASTFGSKKLVFGSFLYRNHFAGYMEMLLPIAGSLFFFYPSTSRRPRSYRRIILDFIKHGAVNKHVWYGFGTVIILIAILLSLSRGGVVCSLVATTAMILVGWRWFHLGRHVGWHLLVGIVLVLLGIGFAGLQKLDTRLGQEAAQEEITLNGRIPYWITSLGIVRDFPVTGTGFGTFWKIYPTYNTRYKKTVLMNAHNDYLENLTDGGVIAVFLVSWFLVVVCKRIPAAFHQTRDPRTQAILLGTSGGIGALMVHSFAEFQFNIATAVALYFFFLCGVAVVVAAVGGKRSAATRLRAIDMPLPMGVFLLVTTAIVLAGTLLFHEGTIRAHHLLALEKKQKIVITASTDKEKLQQSLRYFLGAIRLDPFTASPYFYAGKIYDILGDTTAADNFLRQAVRLQPTDATSLQQYGFFLGKQGQVRRAEALLQASIQREKGSPVMHQFYGIWLMGRNRRQEALAQFRQEFALNPSAFGQEAPMLLAMQFSPDDILQILPDQLALRLKFARFLAKQGKTTAAAKAFAALADALESREEVQPWFFIAPFRFYMEQKEYNKALQIVRQGMQHFPDNPELYIDAGKALFATGREGKAAVAGDRAFALLRNGSAGKPRAWYFTSLYRLYRKLEQPERAEEVLRKGTELLPRDAGLHLALGDYYRSRKMSESAFLEYQQANVLKPGDKSVQKRLDSFKTAEEKIEEQVDALLRLQE